MKSSSFFWSQNNSENSTPTGSNTGISSEISNLLDSKEVIYPIKTLNVIIYKAEKKVDFFVTDSTSKKHHLLREIVKLSSNLNGPILYDDDINLPEGKYKIQSFSSKQTTSFLLDFPNKFDISKQKADNRPPLKSKISIGISESNIVLDSSIFNKIILFNEHLSSENIEIIVVPNDFRNGKPIPFCLTCPPWIEELYGNLRITLKEFE